MLVMNTANLVVQWTTVSITLAFNWNYGFDTSQDYDYFNDFPGLYVDVDLMSYTVCTRKTH